MMIVSGIRSTIRGSSLIAIAMLVSGPTGTSAIGSPVVMYVSTRKSTALRDCLTDRGAGIGSSSPCMAPFSLMTSRRIGKSSLAIGVAIPSKTGVSRPSRSNTRSVLSVQ